MPLYVSLRPHPRMCLRVHKKNIIYVWDYSLPQAMNPINPGVKWWREPSLIAFFGWQPVVVLYAIFFGFHNPYAGDFGPFVTFHDGAFDFSAATKEWQRLH
jgi:hypothetical protein